VTAAAGRRCRIVLRLRPGMLVPAAVLAMGTLLATPAGAAPAEDASVLDSYVALGDSYSAGPLVPDPTGQPAGCRRSTRSFPSLVAQRGGVPDFTDVSCTGATTADLLAPQATAEGTDHAQLDALTEDTEGVTLTIGADDIGFAGAVAECAARSSQRPEGAACRDAHTAGGEDELRRRIDETAPRVAAVLAAVAGRAPDARVLVVGYPAVLPGSGPGCLPAVPLSPGDVEYLRETQEALNAMLAEQADAAGVGFVDTHDRFAGHDVCQRPGVRWVEGPTPADPSAPLGPNAQGMVEVAGEVLTALGQRSS
jgi:GDSL-like lipase/acylhydrolase family protein